MKDFQQQVVEYIQKKNLIKAGDHVCVACSGGADSIALLHLLKTHEQTLDIKVSAVHVNHMLRGEESAADRLFTEKICRQWDLPYYSTAIPLPELIAAEGGNKQALCRQVRYQYFEEVMKKAQIQKLATAHHADDQLETLLMTGIRGTLHTGGFGIPASRPFAEGHIIRPFLSVSREVIDNYIDASGLVFRQDPSNFSTVYTRNRLRHQIVPLLKEEDPEVSIRAAVLAEAIQEDQQYLQETAKYHLHQLLNEANEEVTMSAEAFRQQPAALQKRMLPLLLSYLYPKEHVHLTVQLAEQMQEIMRGSSGTVFLHLPDKLMMVREYDQIRFHFPPKKPDASDCEVSIGSDWSEPVNGFRYKIVPFADLKFGDYSSGWHFLPEGRLPLTIRTRKSGDRIHLAGMSNPKKVARLMIDEKVPLTMRQTWPLVVSRQDEVLLIPGLRPSKHLTKSPQHGSWLLLEQRITPH